MLHVRLIITLFVATLCFTSLATAAERRPVDYVDPLIDTHNSRWFYFSSACRPFGMVNLSPDTRVNGTWQSGYLYDDSSIRCFSHIHGWQLAGIPVMPTTGEFKGDQGMDAYQSDFSHDDEVVVPGYHKVFLKRYGITAELTSTCRVGFHRYTFPASPDSYVLFDTGALLGDGSIIESQVQPTGDAEIAGYSLLAKTERRPKDTYVYFVAQFSRPFAEFGGWRDGKRLAAGMPVAGKKAGAYVRYQTVASEPILLKVAISYTSIEGARRNLDAELPGWDFDQVRTESRDEWDRWLGRVEVSGGTPQQRTKFYTDLWHALLGRRTISDVDGSYCDMTGSTPIIRQKAVDAAGVPRFAHYNFDALWGSHWSLNILWSMAYPDVMDGFCNTMIDMYRDGGLIPRGPAGGNYTYVMIGDPAAPFFASAYHKGIRSYDIAAAYEGLRKNAFPGGIRDHAGYEHAANAAGGGMKYYVDLGYVPEDMGGGGMHRDGAAMTLEYAYEDWCLAQLAKSLGKTADYELFTKRAQNYRHLWDNDLKLMRPRMKNGKWMPDFQLLGQGLTAPGFCESNTMIYTNFVPHDMAGLVTLFGGNKEYARFLNASFEKAAPYRFVADHGHHAETVVDYDNQPGTAMAHLFNYCGKPWLTQKWVREVKEQAFGDVTPYGGYHGDEDQGQMGALGVLMAIGLFEVDGGASVEPIYEITTPIFDRVVIRLDPKYFPGGKFEIVAGNNSSKNTYIQSARYNGQPLERCWITHRDLVQGGRLELELGPKPNRAWGVVDPPELRDLATVSANLPSVERPPVYAPRPEIYHDAWIDLNKNGEKDPYEDPTLDIDARIANLLGQMTLDEKTAQMATLYGFPRVLTDELPTRKWESAVWKDGIGNIDEHCNGNTNYGRPIADPENDLPLSRHAMAMNEVQRFFIEQTRLGVPADMTNEGVRGLLHSHATSFPSQLGVASAWNQALVRDIGRIVASEARALGYTNIYSPVLDLPRDPRWGRTCECYSEDPFLTGELGAAMVESMQSAGVAATCKHFAVYGIPNGGRDGAARTDPQTTWRDVETLHLQPFRRAVRDAGAMGVMASYNDYNGTPIEASRLFLTDILRKEWGFTGYVVSDSGAVEDLQQKHRVTESYPESVRQAVEAGMNVRTSFNRPENFVRPLRQLVEDGKLSGDVIDARVSDVLRVKFRLGLFDHPYVSDPEAANQVVGCEAHQEIARQAARESIVLLKNEGELLPLVKQMRKVLVTGPLADNGSAWWDRYGPQRLDYVTPLAGIRAKLGKDCEVVYEKGCDVVDSRYPMSDVYKEPPTASEQRGIDAAVAAAADVDVIIAVLGEDEDISREDRSRISLDLPGHQEELLRALHATCKPVVLVLSSGRPLSINWANDHVGAVVEMWFSNQDGGNAIADVLFGDYNPAGRLPITFPRSVGQIPIAFPVRPAAQAADGGQVSGPLYSFGHGLSYTTFRYDKLHIAPSTQVADGEVEITCDVTNIGNVAGDEIVQLYVRDDVSSLTAFEQSLRGFERVRLEPQETKSVRFTLKPEHLALYDEHGEWTVEPGTFTVMVGASSADIRLEGQFEIASEADGIAHAKLGATPLPNASHVE
jgi:beta-glucosidase